MSIFRTPVRSLLSKALSTGLVATAIVSTPVRAREHRAERHAEQSVGSTIPRIKGDRWFAEPAAHASAPEPSDQPGGVCDEGDNPMIC